MYPSGSWRGHWEQPIYGRQAMRDLVLRFRDGCIEGHGVDIVGKFTFCGTYDQAGSVTLLKQYIGKHQVLYQGRYDGEGTILGEWSFSEIWRGPFALSPESFSVPSDAPILSISASPVREVDAGEEFED